MFELYRPLVCDSSRNFRLLNLKFGLPRASGRYALQINRVQQTKIARRGARAVPNLRKAGTSPRLSESAQIRSSRVGPAALAVVVAS